MPVELSDLFRNRIEISRHREHSDGLDPTEYLQPRWSVGVVEGIIASLARYQRRR